MLRTQLESGDVRPASCCYVPQTNRLTCNPNVYQGHYRHAQRSAPMKQLQIAS